MAGRIGMSKGVRGMAGAVVLAGLCCGAASAAGGVHMPPAAKMDSP